MEDLVRANRVRFMRYRLVAATVAGAVFFGVLPVFAPPVVLQADEIPYFLLGLGISAVAGAVLSMVVGGSLGRGLVVVAGSVFVGAVLYEFLYAIPVYGLSEGPVSVLPLVVVFTVVYLGLPALLGAAIAGAASVFAARLLRRRGEER